MWNLRCFLCASNEGVFLDITGDNKHTFSEQLETCFLIKVPIECDQESKICYKCAYELSQCTLFVEKYRKSCDTSRLKGRRIENHCTLCAEPAEKGHIFDLKKDINSLNIFFEKTKKIFNVDFVREEDESKLVCLTCRYILDLLFDLKNVFQHTKNKLNNVIREDIDYLCYPKTKTTVVNRKTTISKFAQIEIDSSSDSDVRITNMARKKAKNNILKIKEQAKSTLKLRVCDKCKNTVENGGDMYRFHKTGLTVCKTCWLITDPSRSITQKRKQAHSIETRLCTVFLKDVLTHETFKNEKVYRVEEDEQGNKTYIITDESSESESKSQKDFPIKKEPVFSDVDISTKRKNLKRATRSHKIDVSDSEDHISKKRKANHNEEKKPEEVATEKSLPKLGRVKSKQKIVKSKTSQSSDSDSSTRIGSRRNTRLVKTSISSTSDADIESKQDRKKLKTILASALKNVKNITGSDGSTSNEENRGGRKRTRKAATSAEAVSNEKIKNHNNEDVKRTRSSSISGTEVDSSMRSTKRRPSLPTTVENPDPISTIITSDNESSKRKVDYKCNECELTFDNKLDSMAHKLTHSKQLEIKLQKISLEDIQKEKQAAKESQLVDELLEDQSEVLKMTVEDDEEEEETMVNADATSDVRNELVTESSDNNIKDRDNLSEKVTSNDQLDEKLSTEKDSSANKEEDSQNKEKEPAVSGSSSEVDLKRRLSKNNDNVINNSNREECENHTDEAGVCEESIDADNSKKEADTNSEKTDQVDAPMEKQDVENNSEEKKDTVEHTKINEMKEETVDIELRVVEPVPSSTNSNGPIISATDSNEDEENKISSIQQNGGDDKDVESDTDIKIVDAGSSQNSNEVDKVLSPKEEEIFEVGSINRKQAQENSEQSSTPTEIEVLNTQKDGLIPDSDKIQLVEEDTVQSDVIKQGRPSTDSESRTSATEVLKEVFDLATAEVRNRQKATSGHNASDNMEAETLENISREVQNSADMPSLDPIASADGEDDSTSAVREDNSTPATREDDSTPAAREDNSTPTAKEDGSTPAVKEDGSTPAVKEDDSIPADREDNTTPAAKEDDSTPAAKEDDSTPAVKEDHSKPAAKEDDFKPAAKEDDSTSAARDDDSTPAAKEDDSTSETREDVSTPANRDDDSTPANRDDDSTPAKRKDDSTPANREDDSTPANREDDSTSANKEDDTTLANKKDDSVPSNAADN